MKRTSFSILLINFVLSFMMIDYVGKAEQAHKLTFTVINKEWKYFFFKYKLWDKHGLDVLLGTH